MAETLVCGNVSQVSLSIWMFGRSAQSVHRDVFETVTYVPAMIKLLFAIAAFALRSPDLHTMKDLRWQPSFAEPSELQLSESTVAILTHCSQRFDPLRQTAPSVQRVVSTMKSQSLPVLYLHDRYNSLNPAWCYLYDDWNPTAYISSDVGNIDFKIPTVTHVVCMGGFFEQCERSTVTDLVRLWRRDNGKSNFRITQVVDATFNVAAYVNFTDVYNDKVRGYFKQKLSLHQKAVLGLDEVLARIDDKTLIPRFLQRQLPPIPSGVNVVMDIFGEYHVSQWISMTAPTLTFAYRHSDDFIEYSEFQPNPDQPIKSWSGQSTSAGTSFSETIIRSSTVIEGGR